MSHVKMNLYSANFTQSILRLVYGEKDRFQYIQQ